jgi:hypothetical protein
VDPNGGAFPGELRSAWAAPSGDGSQLLFLGYGGYNSAGGVATAAGAGKVYLESTATAMPANNSDMSYITRRIYANGVGGEWEAQELYGYAPVYSGNPVVSYTPMKTKTNDTGEINGGTKSVTLQGQKMHKVNFRQMNEGLRVSASISTTGAYGQDHIIIDATEFGAEDAGRA